MPCAKQSAGVLCYDFSVKKIVSAHLIRIDEYGLALHKSNDYLGNDSKLLIVKW